MKSIRKAIKNDFHARLPFETATCCMLLLQMWQAFGDQKLAALCFLKLLHTEYYAHASLGKQQDIRNLTSLARQWGIFCQAAKEEESSTSGNYPFQGSQPSEQAAAARAGGESR